MLFYIILFTVSCVSAIPHTGCDPSTGFCSQFLSSVRIQSGMWTHSLAIILPTSAPAIALNCMSPDRPGLVITEPLTQSRFKRSISAEEPAPTQPSAPPTHPLTLICQTLQPSLDQLANYQLKLSQKFDHFLSQYSQVTDEVSARYLPESHRSKRGLFSGLQHLFGFATTDDVEKLSKAVEESTKLAKSNAQSIHAVQGELVSYEAQQQKQVHAIQGEIMESREALNHSLLAIQSQFNEVDVALQTIQTNTRAGIENVLSALGRATLVQGIISEQLLKIVDLISVYDGLISAMTTLLGGRLDLRLVPVNSLVTSLQALQQSITDQGLNIGMALSTNQMMQLYREAEVYPILHSGVITLILRIPTVDSSLGPFNAYEILALPISFPLEDLPASQITQEGLQVASTIHSKQDLSAQYELEGQYLFYSPRNGLHFYSASPPKGTYVSTDMLYSYDLYRTCGLALLLREDHTVVSSSCNKKMMIKKNPILKVLTSGKVLVTSATKLSEVCGQRVTDLKNTYGAIVDLRCGCSLKVGPTGQTPISSKACRTESAPLKVTPVLFSIWARPNATSASLAEIWENVQSGMGEENPLGSILQTNLADNFLQETEHLTRSTNKVIKKSDAVTSQQTKQVDALLIRNEADIDATISKVNSLLPDVSATAAKVLSGLLIIGYGLAICGLIVGFGIMFMRIKRLYIMIGLVMAQSQVVEPNLILQGYQSNNFTNLQKLAISIYPKQTPVPVVQATDWWMVFAVSLLTSLISSLVISMVLLVKSYLLTRTPGGYFPLLGPAVPMADLEMQQLANREEPQSAGSTRRLRSFPRVDSSSEHTKLWRSCCKVFGYLEVLSFSLPPLRFKVQLADLPKGFIPSRIRYTSVFGNLAGRASDGLRKRWTLTPEDSEASVIVEGKNVNRRDSDGEFTRRAITLYPLQIKIHQPDEYPLTSSVRLVAVAVECISHPNKVYWIESAPEPRQENRPGQRLTQFLAERDFNKSHLYPELFSGVTEQ